jgi:hypothetical protein
MNRTARIYDNADALRAGIVPCETDPASGGLSRTLEPFHAAAELTAGSQRGSLRHVCAGCARAHHQHLRQRPGVLWS